MAYFLQDRENIFRSESRLPRNYWTGISISLVYLFLLAALSVLIYLRRMKGLDKKSLRRFGKEDLVFTGSKWIEFYRGAFSEFDVYGTSFRDLLFQVFSGNGPRLVKNGLQLNVWLETNNLCQTGTPVPFFYLCNAALFPSALKVKDLLTDAGILPGLTPTELKTLQEQEEIKPLLEKRLGELEDDERFEAVCALLVFKKKDVYILDQVDKGLPTACTVKLKQRIDGLLQQGAVVIVLRPMNLSPKQKQGKEAIVPFLKNTIWTFTAAADYNIMKVNGLL